MKIYDLVPDPEVMIQLATEELAYQLLRVVDANAQRGMAHRNTVLSTASEPGQRERFDYQTQRRVEPALHEALHWLEMTGLVLPAPGDNGRNGYIVLSRRGKGLVERGQFDSFRRATAFPKELLHASISERVWLNLARGELDTAVFQAYKAVEEAVRDAGGFDKKDIGVDLMRKAFDPTNGPLTDQAQPVSEREALAHLFAGAIGSYKNPHSHRTVAIDDIAEAQEMVMLASHLLRIVDARRTT